MKSLPELWSKKLLLKRTLTSLTLFISLPITQHNASGPRFSASILELAGKSHWNNFHSAAEKFGYVVACSNNSRNGLDADVVTKIVTAFWRDLHDRFAIDEQRTYFAGFSGGARLSVGLANRCNGCVAGVIACGAGYPGEVQPNTKTTLSFVGAVGYDDFNFGELRELENKFDELPIAHRFYQFVGRP